MFNSKAGGEADGALAAPPPPARCRARAPKPSARPNKAGKRNQKQGSQKVSQNFLGRGDVTEQNGRVAAASRLNSEVYVDEATARAFAANPLGESPAYSVAPCLDFHRYASRYVTFGSSAITSGHTCPIYSPSIQHPKLSKRSIFLSSSP